VHGKKGPERAGANKGVRGEAPAGSGAAAPGFSLRRAKKKLKAGGTEAHFVLQVGLGGQKTAGGVNEKVAPS
jgi:hypothetical protein